MPDLALGALTGRRRAGASASEGILGRLRALDEGLLRLARTRGHTPGRERAVAGFSRVGEHAGVWLAIGATGGVLDRPRAHCWRRAVAVVIGAYVLNTAIKVAVGRARPQLEGLPALVGTPTGLGFPSAHATSSFAGALVYSRLGLPPTPLYALAAGLAASRVYLGVHHPSDVIGGALLGSALAGAAPRCARGESAGVARYDDLGEDRR